MQVTIPGIGKLNRNATKKAIDIAADEYGTTDLKRDWSYKYDSKTDTYTFYNNKEIEKGEIVYKGYVFSNRLPYKK